jgi:hypothetical protein
MGKRCGVSKPGPAIPEDVKNLLYRKIRMLRHEHELRLQSELLAITAKRMEALKANIGSKGVYGFIQPSIDSHKNIVRSVSAATKSWPGIVWETIQSILEKARITTFDSQELNAIVDEFAWATGEDPFTLKHVNTESYAAAVFRDVSRSCGIPDDAKSSFLSQLSIASGHVDIVNNARWIRQKIKVAIDEYCLISAANHSTQPTSKREARKMDTQAIYKGWQKAYRILKKKHPDKSDIWHSRRIANMDCAKGRDSETIRKNMKK